MSVSLYLLLFTGLFAVVAGVVSGWRTGGKNIALIGLVNVSVAVGLFVAGRTENLRLPALALIVIVIFAALAGSDRPSWRAVRTVAFLGGILVAQMWALASLPTGPSAIRNVLLVAMLVTAILFLAAMAWQVINKLPLLSSNSASGPRH